MNEVQIKTELDKVKVKVLVENIELIEEPLFRYHPIGGWDEENQTWWCLEYGS